MDDGRTGQSRLTDVVLDAMGSDNAPEPELQGAILACRELAVRVHLVGPQERLRIALDKRLRGEQIPIEIVHASEWVSMSDKAAQAVRSKRDSSMRVGLKMIREGRAAGFFTAGNTGAAMATAKMVLGSLEGIDRPALMTVLPTQTGKPCLLLDAGANVDSQPRNLAEFAIMGKVYAEQVLRVSTPRIALLSIAEADSDGNSLTRETLPLLRNLNINFVGNVEARDLFSGRVDVVVCDGFVGNVALKTSEGLVRLINNSLKSSMKSTVISTLGALLSRRASVGLKKRLDYTEYGGAPLLGIRGVCAIGHGSSTERAILNGIRLTADFARAELNARIEAELLGGWHISGSETLHSPQ